MSLATSTAVSPFARSEAIRALAGIGSEPHIETLLASVIDVAPEIDHGVAGALIERFHPRWMSTDRVITLMAKARRPAPQSSSLLTYYLGQKALRDTPEGDRARLLQATLDLVHVEGEPKQTRKSWLLSPLANMVTELASNLGDMGPQSILPALRLFAGLGHHVLPELGLAHEQIRKLIADRVDLRRLLFWDDVAAVARKQKKRVRRYLDLLGTDRLWRLTADDAGWLADDARSRPAIHERLLAFDCLVSATPIVDGSAAEREQLVAALSDGDPAIRKHFERYNRRATTDHREPMWERKHRLHEAQEKKQHQENVDWLNAHQDQLADGSAQRALVTLAAQGDLDGEDPEAALARLAKQYSDAVAAATREGWRRLWRQLRCKLPHEEQPRNTFDHSMIVGMGGLALDIAFGLDLSNLTPVEARDAVRYASRGMNHFPSWLEALANAQPEAVTEIFAECIVADYRLLPEDPPPHAVLHLLSHAAPIVQQLCWDTVAGLIASSEPPRLDTLRDCVELVLATPASRAAALATAVPPRCRASRGDRERYALWWSLWFVLAPVAAMDEIEMAIDDPSVDPDDLVLKICDTVWRLREDRRIGFPLPSDAAVLVRLVSIVFRHVRPDDDIQHLRAHVVGTRDHAQSLRDHLLDRLAVTPGEITYDGLCALAEMRVLATSRDMLLALADQRLTQDMGTRDTGVAERLVRAYEAHGLATTDHLEEAGFTTMTNALTDFGILTALPEERDAVLTQIGDYRELDKDGADTLTYYEAIVQTRRQDGARYRIIVACCPEMGPEVAVATASALLSRWKPRHLMLVGIALGLKGEAKHGDVLLADQVADYVLGKKEEGKKRITRWKGHLAGASLFESARALRSNWTDSIKAKRSGEGVPEVVIGTVASGGDVVLDDELLAEFQATWPKLVGVEMEAGGTATAAHHRVHKPEFLMIKAVSDHGKDKHDPVVLPWREYAYAVAAAFALELLRRGPAPALKK